MQLSFWKRLLFTAFVMTLGVALTGCSDDETVDNVNPEVSVTESLTFDCTKTETQYLEVSINGNTEWFVGKDEWIEMKDLHGYGSTILEVTVQASDAPRSGHITVSAVSASGAVASARCAVRQVKEGSVLTNVAEIRKEVLAARPGSEPTELGDGIRAKSLTGIVVSDRKGGNQQPFIVVLADDTRSAGAGLSVAISQDKNQFKPGDVVEVSLSDAKAQLYNGLLQLSTRNVPEVTSEVEPLAPVAITADRLDEYQSQYVKIENVQPEASEKGCWNNDNNKGNVSMMTREGLKFKVRTQPSAVYAQEEIPADKSGWVAGIAGVYNDILQLQPRNGEDISLTEARFTVEGQKATLAEVLAGDTGVVYEVENAVVVGKNEMAVMLEQDGARMYAEQGTEHHLTLGDVVTVKGSVDFRNGLKQFSKGSTLAKTGHREAAQPAPVAMNASDIEAYAAAPEVKYVKYTGVVLMAGVYTNVEIEGCPIKGSLDYMSEEFRQKYNNHKVEITGWLFGAYKGKNGTFMYTIPVEVKDAGEVEEVVPEGAIYYSTFDKALASQGFGESGDKWPFLEEFDGWVNHKGSGVEAVTYDFKSVSARANQSSEGALSLYDGSGKNNIFFSTAPNFFTIQKIKVNAQNLRLSFGAQRYAQGASNTFIKSDFEVRLSADGQVWSQAVDYDFNNVEDKPGNWRMASADFTLPAGTAELYIKFEAKMSSVNRIDDVLLVEGRGGQLIEFGKEEVIATSTIAQVLDAPVDETYQVEGQVAGIHGKGFLVKDNTGTMLVFKKNHGVVVGDFVTVKGATSLFGGLKQFGETSEVTKTGHGNFTMPEPESFGPGQFPSYLQQPSIRYIRFEGVLSSFRDSNYQWHYEVTPEGLDIKVEISYPASDLSIEKFVGNKVIVVAYAVGARAQDKKVYSMASSVEFAEKDSCPAESETLSVEELNARLSGMESGAPLAELVGVRGYVAANNEGGNMYQLISLVDNTGKPFSGIIIKSDDYKEKDLPVGTKVIVSLRHSTYELYNGLPEIKTATIYPTSEKVTMNVPEITVEQCPDYLGQYVMFRDVTPDASATTWVVGNKSTNTLFKDASGRAVAARVTRFAEFASEKIAHRSGTLKGIMQVFNGTYQVFPNSYEDVADFKVTE